MLTVVEALEHAAQQAPWGHTFVRPDQTEHEVSFAALQAEALAVGRGLRALGLRRGDRVALVTPDPEHFVVTFYGALLAGIVPVPLYPPATMTKLGAYGATLTHVLRTAGTRVLVAPASLHEMLAGLFPPGADAPLRLVDPDTIPRDQPAPAEERKPGGSDLALLQFTSGSTSSPKGIAITHEQLAANARAIMHDGLRTTREDRAVSWLPLYHDMGLIGFVVAPVFTQVATTFLPTSSFIRRPSVWLQTIHRQRGTMTFAPNFAYALTTRAVGERHMEGWDLSCLRVAGCGAEPIVPGVLRAFADKFARVGFRSTAFLPAYGMAEATLAITFAELGRPLLTDIIDAASLKEGAAVPAPGAADAVELVGCGKPPPGFTVEIRDPAGVRLGDRRVGAIFARGPSVASGYFENPEATAATFRDGWLATGDLGYTVEGELYICGREKDLIIIHGRNYYPQDLEASVCVVDGLRDGQAAIFTAPIAGLEGEGLVVVAESTRKAPEHDELMQAVARTIREDSGLVVAQVVLIRRGTLPKTSSGKVRRSEARHRFLGGTLELAGNSE